jgi:hypothetical protein
MRVRIVLGVAIAWLVAAAPGLAADRIVERGVVQSVAERSLLLRALDGAELDVPVTPRTRVRLNGLPATLADLRPGFVAEVVRHGSRPAARVRAFGRLAREVERGRLLEIGRAVVVLRDRALGRLRIELTEGTVVRSRGGRRATLRALRRGMRVEVVRAANGTARVVRITRRAD